MPPPYTADYDAELAEKALAKYSGGTIWLLGRAAMSFALGDHLRRKLTKAKFVDASDSIDRIKAVKSPEELERIRKTAALQDQAMEETFAAIKPGMRTDRNLGRSGRAHHALHLRRRRRVSRELGLHAGRTPPAQRGGTTVWGSTNERSTVQSKEAPTSFVLAAMQDQFRPPVGFKADSGFFCAIVAILRRTI